MQICSSKRENLQEKEKKGDRKVPSASKPAKYVEKGTGVFGVRVAR